ncbi:GNAT superfamily N-acetyltransferase [Dysgonomonas sp. PFB1-18]|uniref:GNAT family N-acetyltransferase n=1 Tax=unclassified Dysgonomonas TaxID=2630389 RepID=UPI002474FBB3|nr:MULTISPECIES: GNAT family N-acetyltransferase [unclassified Dysgonomonas]MDH6307447.1 GNAT superfamily N-acetyltransferase [Dysgonomonas sp. PF1-14]MDH6337365.1 GNAT superfamily N-acetyltransferase [Dysgonomonas sp. PF1-16]MDH6379289.1 GNAT superfamily N-acetyltransferase [Dysgonomonas sp. PFB1-18]MDH6396073.1 GNAT superfamily N-acetyltransferase [Dysgonomonas sp. PF1-23]
MDGIRDARINDTQEIANLLEQLGYAKPIDFVEKQLAKMLSDNSYKVIVYEQDGKAIALMTIHFYWQIGYEGEFANIGFFVVDSSVRSKGIGRLMEEYCTALATERACAMIELYSNEKRLDAHRFYERQGYKSYEKFFVKEIDKTE